jgi:N-acyl-D-amino-acid deacylase
MHDLVITGATIVDGTGAPARMGDVAISGERIVEVADRPGALGGAHHTIDADGLLLAPGWVDIHTHYDGQITWDPELAPSATNGVTSILVGNCGVGFAPARPDKHDWLISLLEGVEDIPGTALAEGMSWGWESFPQYLDVLSGMNWTLDVGTQIPHAALRTYVMGERGADHTVRASADDITQMAKLTREAVDAGAMGFTTSRTWAHRSSLGEQIGTLTAGADEVLGIVSALKEAQKGVIQLISDAYQSTDDELVAAEFNLLERIALQSSRPMSFTVQQNDDTPDRYQEIFAKIDEWRAAGAEAKAQVAVRPIGVLIGLNGSACPLNFSVAYRSMRHLPLGERVARLSEPAVRERIMREHAAATPTGFPAIIHSGYSRMYPLTDPINYEPTPEHSVAGLAAKSGLAAADVLFDLMLSDNGNRLLYIPLMNYARGSLDDVYNMITYEHAMFGLSDAGAHCNAISDGSFPTTALTHWTRDRTRGPRLPIEQIVHHQTQRTATHVGWTDRGVVAAGYLADLNVIDMATLRNDAPRLVADLPAGGTRLLQHGAGYRYTIKRGQITVDDGHFTGSRPGRLQR